MDKQNKIIGIVGRKGSGKSTMLREILIHNPRLLIFNTMGEHDWAADQISDLDVLQNYLDGVTDPKEKFQVSFTPMGEIDSDFDVVANNVFGIGNMTFAIEELPMLTRSPGFMQPSLGRIFRLGRHRSLNIVWTAQRAAEVPRGVTGATDFFIFFSQTEPRDLKALEERTSPEYAQEVSQLGLHDFLTYDVIERTIGSEEELEEQKDVLLSPGEVSKTERRKLFKENEVYASTD